MLHPLSVRKVGSFSNAWVVDDLAGPLMNVGMHGTRAEVGTTGDAFGKYVKLASGEERDA